MVNFHKEIVTTLKTILPTYYEMFLHRNIPLPCISYMELANTANETGDTLGYSKVQYQVTVWGSKLEEIQTYTAKIDNALRVKGWKRISCNEMYDSTSTMIQKILVYEANALEEFK